MAKRTAKTKSKHKGKPARTLEVRDDLRLVGVRGTNKVMAGELSRLAGRAFDHVRLPAPAKEGLGTLVYPFSVELAALALRYHRTCSRVLWSLFESRARRLEPLYDDLLAAMRQESRPWFRDGASFSITPNSNLKRFAAGARQVVGVVKNAVIDGAASQGMRLRVDPERPEILLTVRMRDDTVIVSVDLAGESMNLRGYRAERGAAPLRENLAAVLVMLARHDGRAEALVDPMAGSGTIAIEAACMAQGRPLRQPTRRPAAARLAAFSAALAEPSPPLFGDTRPLVFANELDARVSGVSRRNTAAAGVDGLVVSSCGDFRALDADAIRQRVAARGLDPDRGLLLCNPPYGERLAPAELEQLYRDLGQWCRQMTGWRAGFLVANEAFEPAFGGRPRIVKPLPNGPLEGFFYLYDL